MVVAVVVPAVVAVVVRGSCLVVVDLVVPLAVLALSAGAFVVAAIVIAAVSSIVVLEASPSLAFGPVVAVSIPSSCVVA